MGMAPEALLFSWNFAGNVTLEMDQGVINQQIEITQNSYGYGATYDVCTRRGEYDANSIGLDNLVRKYPHLLHVYAAGNSRSSNCLPGGYGTVNSGYQAAKNNLVVGAITRTDGNSTFHGYGPVRDGRLKPEVCAVGVNVYSTFPINDYRGGYNGTSMACPGAAGTVSLLYEWYKTTFNQLPPAHLLKGVMSNGADDLGRPGPDYQYGFGRINAARSLSILTNNLYRVDSVNQNGVFTDTFSLSTTATEIKIMLNWDDLSGSPSSSKMLVNDLDLILILPNGDTLLPWGLNPALFTQDAIRKVDTLNNTEQITLISALPGLYTIVVRGTVVPMDYQVFSVNRLIQNPELTIVYPNGGEKMNPPSNATNAQIIRWDAYGIFGNAKLEYSIDSGQTWTTIVNSVNINNKQYTWSNCPASVRTARALVRISIGGFVGESSRVFHIAPQPNSPSAILCDSQVHLKWDKTPDAAEYRVWMHIQGLMTPIGITEDTFFTVRGLINDSTYWFAISTLTTEGAESERSWGVPFIPNNLTQPPRFVTEPRDTTLCYNASITLKPTLSGDLPILYEWQYSADSGASWQNIGNQSDSLILNLSDLSLHLYQYRLSSINVCESEVWSNPMVLSVDTLPDFHVTDTFIALCLGEDTALSVLHTERNKVSYQWYYQPELADARLPLPNQDTTLLRFNAVTALDQGYYGISLQNQCGVFFLQQPAYLYVRPALNTTLTGDTVVCPTSLATLEAFATGGDSSQYAFYWLDDTLTSPSSYNMTHGSSQWIKVGLFDQCSQNPVYDSLYLRSIPVLDMQLPVDSLLCYGQSMPVPLQVFSADFGSMSISWSGGFGGHDSLRFSDPLSSELIVAEVSDQCSVIKDSVQVSMRPPLNLLPLADTTICYDESLYRNLSAIGGKDDAYVFNWDDTYSGISRTWVPSGTQNFKVVLNDGCSLPDSITFRIYVRDPLSLHFGNDTVICKDELYTLNAQVSGGIAPYEYFWNGVKRTATASFTADQDQVISVLVKDGCSPDVADSIMVTTQRPKIPSLQLSDSLLCFGEVVSVSLSEPVFSASWESSDGQSYTSNSWSNSWSAISQISLSLRITDADGCKADTFWSNVIRVVPKALASFTLNSRQLKVNEIPVVATSTNGNAITWDWDAGDGTTFGTSSFQHLYTDTGYYAISLMVEDIAGCTDRSSDTVYVFDDPAVYLPNAFTPNKDRLNDTYKPGITNLVKGEMKIYDRWGALVYECDEIQKCQWDGITLNGAEAEAGVYLVIFRGVSPQNEPILENSTFLLIR